jgi:hypothetical protein
MVRIIRSSMLAAALAAAGLSHAMEYGALPQGAHVRLSSGWIETGTWFTGTVDRSGECAVIRLQGPAPGGFDQVTLLAIRRLQQADDGQWTEVPVSQWLAGEPSECRLGSTD